MSGLTVVRKVEFSNGVERRPEEEVDTPTQPPIPRIAQLMALAIRFEEMLRDGEVRNQSEMAVIAGVTRARVSQIMGLLNLSPEIQENLLFEPQGRCERELRSMLSIACWGRQETAFSYPRQSEIVYTILQ